MTNASLKLEALEEAIYSKVLEVIRLLRESKRRIVLAESCTGGLASAWFTSVPGASDVFCGSMVVYRNDTKSQWLGLDPQMLADEKIGPVGSQASEQLAREVLSRTPEANIALSITGHFGPNAPEHLDGWIFLAATSMKSDGTSPNSEKKLKVLPTRSLQLKPPDHPFLQELQNTELGESKSVATNSLCDDVPAKKRRLFQQRATESLLSFGLDILKNEKSSKSDKTQEN